LWAGLRPVGGPTTANPEACVKTAITPGAIRRASGVSDLLRNGVALDQAVGVPEAPVLRLREVSSIPLTPEAAPEAFTPGRGRGGAWRGEADQCTPDRLGGV
jgi:hypothetical protein